MTLVDFLVENPVDNVTEEITNLSNRLSGFTFKVKAIGGEEFSEYQQRAFALGMGSSKTKQFNQKLFNELVILNHVVEPDFKHAESIKKASCNTPEQFLYKSLLSGEITELQSRITKLSGFNQTVDDMVKEVKNG